MSTSFIDTSYNSANEALSALKGLVKSLSKLDARPRTPAEDVSFDATKFSRAINVLKQHVPNQFPPGQAPQYSADTQGTQVDAILHGLADILLEFRDRTQRPVESIFKSVAAYADFNHYCQKANATNDAEAEQVVAPARLAN